MDRFFARVLDNNDPEKLGRLKVRCDQLIQDGDLADWIQPAFPYAGANQGFFFLPDKGAMVEVEVEGHADKVIEHLSPRWVSVLYTAVDAIPVEFKSNPTKRGGIKFGDVVLTFDKASHILALVAANVRLGTEGATHPVTRGDTYNTQLATFLTALQTFLAAITTYTAAIQSIADPSGAATTALTAATTAMTTAASSFSSAASTWLSTKVKTE